MCHGRCQVHIYGWTRGKPMMKHHSRIRTHMWRAVLSLGTTNQSTKSMFYSSVVYDYMTGIWQVYIYLSYLISCTLEGPPGLLSAPGRFRPGLLADYLRFSDGKVPNQRLAPTKVPHPRVDIVNMAAPAGFPSANQWVVICNYLKMQLIILIILELF